MGNGSDKKEKGGGGNRFFLTGIRIVEGNCLKAVGALDGLDTGPAHYLDVILGIYLVDQILGHAFFQGAAPDKHGDFAAIPADAAPPEATTATHKKAIATFLKPRACSISAKA
jgi:hypothetical protein